MIFVAWEWVCSYFANGSLLKFSLPCSDFCMRCFVPLFYLLFGAHLISSTLIWAHWSLYEMRLVWVSFTPTLCVLFFFSIFPCFGYLVMECIITPISVHGSKELQRICIQWWIGYMLLVLNPMQGKYSVRLVFLLWRVLCIMLMRTSLGGGYVNDKSNLED